MDAIAFYGGQRSAPRVSVIPGAIHGYAPVPETERAWLDLRDAARDLSRVKLRWCFWHGAAMLCKLGPSPAGCISRFPIGARGRFDEAPPWLLSLDAGQHELRKLSVQCFEQIAGQLCSRDRQSVRVGGMRYGIAGDGVSDLAFAVDPEGVPPLMDDLCSFLTSNLERPWAIPVAFRQVVLLHAFPDGNGRLARYLACLHSEAAAMPRHLLLPALAAFQGTPSMRAEYGAALTASSASAFVAYLHQRTVEIQNLLSVWGNRLDEVESEGMELLKAASFGRRLHARLLHCPSASLTEIAALALCSERNAARWMDTFTRSGMFSFDGRRLVWTGLVDAMEDLSRFVQLGIVDRGATHIDHASEAVQAGP